jgi:hypothetical protein
MGSCTSIVKLYLCSPVVSWSRPAKVPLKSVSTFLRELRLLNWLATSYSRLLAGCVAGGMGKYWGLLRVGLNLFLFDFLV